MQLSQQGPQIASQRFGSLRPPKLRRSCKPIECLARVFPADPALIKASGAGPVSSAELTPSGRDVRQLPLGRYEVQFAYRAGSELKTFVLRDVILRADRGVALTVELNDARTTIVGGDPSLQQMAEMIRQLQAQVKALQAQMAALQK